MFHWLLSKILVPKGNYCYLHYKCKLCKFFMWIEYRDELGEEVTEGGCSYLKKQGGMLLDYQCKECDLNI